MITKTIMCEYTVAPSPVSVLREEVSIYEGQPIDAESGKHELEGYFNDVYHLFLNRLVKVTHESTVSLEEVLKMQSLFDELIRVKLILQKDENYTDA